MARADLKRLLAKASPADRAALALLMTMRALARAWRKIARTEQLPPWDFLTNTWTTYTDSKTGETKPVRIFYLQGGRGSGKTWSGARMFAEMVLWFGGKDSQGRTREWLIVAPTFDAAWSVCVVGPSGILPVLGDQVVTAAYTRGMIILKSGAVIYVTGADTGAPRAQGRNLSGVWGDEIGLWRVRQWRMAWIESIRPALRIGPALAVMTGTPKQGHPLVQWMIKSERTFVRVIRTRDNRANLDPDALADLEAELAGSRLGRQELDGEFLTDVPGALWTLALIDEHRVDQVNLEDLREIIVGWDPAVTNKATSDEHGIIVVGRGHGTHPELFVLEDASGHYSPDEAVRKVAAVVNRWQATGAVVETNNGGDWIPSLVRQVSPDLVVKTVTATHGKQRRADRVVAVSEQGRLHLVGDQITSLDGATKFGRLVGQMTEWVEESDFSPDRMDGLVWACTYHLNASNTSAASGDGWHFELA